jgi:hypothetical protein
MTLPSSRKRREDEPRHAPLVLRNHRVSISHIQRQTMGCPFPHHTTPHLSLPIPIPNAHASPVRHLVSHFPLQLNPPVAQDMQPRMLPRTRQTQARRVRAPPPNHKPHVERMQDLEGPPCRSAYLPMFSRHAEISHRTFSPLPSSTQRVEFPFSVSVQTDGICLCRSCTPHPPSRNCRIRRC